MVKILGKMVKEAKVAKKDKMLEQAEAEVVPSSS